MILVLFRFLTVYQSVDIETVKVIENVFVLPAAPVFQVIGDMQKQCGGVDCGLFAIAVAVNILQQVPLVFVKQR